MVRDNWNFTANPFEATLTPASFHCGKPQEEALARLEWICQERQRFAIVVGVEGAGKSHLATMPELVDRGINASLIKQAYVTTQSSSFGVTTAGTSATWAFGGKQRTTKSQRESH